MKASDLEVVNVLETERRHLIRLIDELENPLATPLGVTLRGIQQGEDIVALLRPVLATELRGRVARLGRRLAGLGVTD